MKIHNHRQKGAVSLFIVIFAALLITTITVAFIRLMIQNQNQATANDLSRSALDSAQAGVEDAKRVLARYHDLGCSEPSHASDCTQDINAIKSKSCNTIQQSDIFGGSTGSEVKIRTQESDTNDLLLDQAYTCVKITLDTDDYIASLDKNKSRLVPLKGKSSFNKIEIQWYSQRDLQNAQTTITSGTGIDLNTLPGVLPQQASWSALRPALMRLQLLQFNANQSSAGGGFQLAQFDDSSHNASLFLMPSTATLRVGHGFLDNTRKSSTSRTLQQASCKARFPIESYGGYACSAIIDLPSMSNREAYLRVLPIYNTLPVTFRICLGTCDTKPPVKFDGVQPEIDSTGRASDYFRRVKSRVEFTSGNMPNIDAAVDITGNLCKVFEVGETETDYKDNKLKCTP